MDEHGLLPERTYSENEVVIIVNCNMYINKDKIMMTNVMGITAF